jgi:hypothetical protein
MTLPHDPSGADVREVRTIPLFDERIGNERLLLASGG